MSEALALQSQPTLLLGRYRPIRLLGSGGSGSVWLARDEQKDRDVTIKIVPREGKAGARARREAHAMATLDHVRCPRAFASGRDAENVYVVYEYVAGRTLRESLRSGSVKDADAVEVAAQVLEGLAHAHDNGIVHRDVKPANVLLADDDEEVSIRILDFGLARFADDDTLTSAGDVPGTLAYIAPERLRGDAAGPAGDVWSVGVLLYEALAGRHPFWRPSLAETADAIIGGAPPLHVERPDLPHPLLEAVDRALALDPAKRPSAAKLAERLRRTTQGRSRDDGVRPLVDQLERQVLPAILAGVYAAAAVTLLPFYPPHTAPVVATLAAALMWRAPRWGVALALAAPIFPLGNVALALALLYTAVAVLWLVLFRGEPERAFLPVLGPLLGPLAPVALPLAFVTTRSFVRRGLGAAMGVALASAVAAVRAGPVGLGIPGARDAVAVGGALLDAAPPALAYEAAVAAILAAGLPWAIRRGRVIARRAAEAAT